MKIIGLILLLAPLFGQAEQSCFKRQLSPKEFIDCYLHHHLQLQARSVHIQSIKREIDLANQAPNPEVELSGQKNEENGSTYELSYQHTFELGGKRDSRALVAKKRQNLAQEKFIGMKEKIALQAILDLYRYRQLKHEEELEDEIIETFTKIVRQYQKAGKLSPQNKISISIFKMALEENKIKKNILLREKEDILLRLQSGLKQKISLKPSWLPQKTKTWRESVLTTAKGHQLKLAEKKLSLAQANLALQESLSSSDLKIGPKVSIDTGDKKDGRLGIFLSMPLSLYHRNEGGRGKAFYALEKEKKLLEYKKNLVTRKKEILKSRYKRAAKILQGGPSNHQVALKHSKLHKMINRGIVSASVVIELHRQIVEYYQKVHQTELEGVHAWWTLAALEGRILKEELR